MEIYTLYVGQGNLAVVVGEQEAVVVDAHIPPSDDPCAEFVKAALAAIVRGKNVVGIILTGFDADHADPRGVAWVVRRYQPDWVMYPMYKKLTDTAGEVFRIIRDAESSRDRGRRPLERVSVRLDKIDDRVRGDLSREWNFELFSPHPEDMISSNNSSLVAKIIPKGLGGFRYLVTGDTENDRWESINRIFRGALRAEVMAAPHHGSHHGASAETLRHVQPEVVLVSAGVGNQFGHPHPDAMRLYQSVARVYSTHTGTSLRTYYSWWHGIVTETWNLAASRPQACHHRPPVSPPPPKSPVPRDPPGGADAVLRPCRLRSEGAGLRRRRTVETGMVLSPGEGGVPLRRVSLCGSPFRRGGSTRRAR